MTQAVHILIVEDEPPIAEYIEKCARSILGKKINRTQVSYSLEEAHSYLKNHNIDLCLLDLNLSGENGFEILQHAVSKPFHTIIISAHTDLAIQAFEFGVIDFVPKSFNRDRLSKAFERFFNRSPRMNSTRYLVTRKNNKNHLIPVEKIVFLQAARYLVEAHLINGQVELLEKHLNTLEKILPPNFIRTHRAYIVNIDLVASYEHSEQSGYQLSLKNGTALPISRSRYRAIQEILNK